MKVVSMMQMVDEQLLRVDDALTRTRLDHACEQGGKRRGCCMVLRSKCLSLAGHQPAEGLARFNLFSSFPWINADVLQLIHATTRYGCLEWH